MINYLHTHYRLSVLFVSCVLVSFALPEATAQTTTNPNAFITTWVTTESNQTITIPTNGAYAYDYTVDWGDGTDISEYNGDSTHTYTTANTYTIIITGTFPAIYFNGSSHGMSIRTIEQWGNLAWQSMEGSFRGVSNLSISADAGSPDLSSVSSMRSMFRDATNFNSPINDWDVSSVSDMAQMFENASAFNQDLSGWDVGNVTNMSLMFTGASAFNQNLGSWNIGNVGNMAAMFNNANLSRQNYDALLAGWSRIEVRPDVPFSAGSSQYCNHEARDILTSAPNNWVITTDGGLSTSCPLPAGAFVTTWRTTVPNQTITIPTSNNFTYDYTVNWGDGNVDKHIGDARHTYTDDDTYTVVITRTFPAIYFNGSSHGASIRTIAQWGNTVWQSMENSFSGARNLRIIGAAGIPNLSSVTSTRSMFEGATNFNSSIGRWDVSNVTDMSRMFQDASAFNQPLDRPLGDWDVSKVTDMSDMFSGARAFNQDLSMWDVSSVTDMTQMFQSALAFNQPLDDWDVSKVTDMSGMFSGARAFDQNLGSWDVGKVRDMSNMFLNAGLSRQNYEALLAGWSQIALQQNVMFHAGNSQYCNYLARYALTSNPNNWNITDGRRAANCTPPISAFVTTWQVSAGQTINITTNNSNLTYDYIVDWGDGTEATGGHTGDVSHRYTNAGRYTVAITGDFPAIQLDRSTRANRFLLRTIEQWGDIVWRSMANSFTGARNLNISPGAGRPDLSSVTNMSSMFRAAESFNSPIGHWDMSNVTNISRMFTNARAFNQPLGDWDVGNVTNMSAMFNGTSMFNQNLGSWDVGNVRDMSRMFENVTLSRQNYDALLAGWTQIEHGETPLQRRISFHPGNSQYCNQEARDILTNLLDWTIPDNSDSRAANCPPPAPRAGQLPAASLLIPSGLNIGTQIRLLFVGGNTDFTNDDISHYNNEVITAAAESNSADIRRFSDQFRALISSDAVDARDNTATTYTTEDPDVPIYWVGGDKVADNYADFYDGSWDSPNARDNNGNLVNTAGLTILTGSGSNGTGLPNNRIGNRSNGVRLGRLDSDGDEINSGVSGENSFRSLYGLSPVLTLVVTGLQPPVVQNPIPNQIVAAREEFSYTFAENVFSDINMDELTYRVTAPPWLTIDPSNPRTITGTPPSAAVGQSPIYVTVVASDGNPITADASNTFLLTVNPNAPAPLANVRAVAGDGSITVSWDPLVEDGGFPVNQYVVSIFRRFDSNEHDCSVSNNPGATSCTIIDLVNGVEYDRIVVTAYTNFGTAMPRASFTAIDDVLIPRSLTDPAPPEDAFVTAWRFDYSIDEPRQITIPTHSGSNYSYTVDWGDGSTDNTTYNGDARHDYPNDPGRLANYVITISGTFPRIYFNNSGDKEKIQSIQQWGTTAWTSMENSFYGCNNLAIGVNAGQPDLSNVMSTKGMFRDATRINQSINDWDVSSVSNMEGMFNGATAFNQDLSLWDVSNVTDTSSMFNGATAFNQNLSAWVVSAVSDMSGMFNGATAFNQPINDWVVSSVSNMEDIFNSATAFNQPINDWVVSSVSDMSGMFNGATAFNQPLGDWDVSAVSDMSDMFNGATEFNQDLGAWDVSAVTNMSEMLAGVTLSIANYDSLLVGWGRIERGEGEMALTPGVMFSAGNSQYCDQEARDILDNAPNNWIITDLGQSNIDCPPDPSAFVITWMTTISNQTITIPTNSESFTYSYMVDWGDGGTDNTIYTGNASHTYANADTYTIAITGTFPQIYFNGVGNARVISTIEQWGTIAWASMDNSFRIGVNNLIISPTAGQPDLSSVSNMESMFRGATSFNQPINDWDVSSVSNMNLMFRNARKFNQPLNAWDVSRVTDMGDMFNGAIDFNQDLGAWDVGNVRNMSRMLTGVKLSTANYDSLLAGWSQIVTLQERITFDAGESQYCNQDARDILTSAPNNWIITDGGLDEVCTLQFADDTSIANQVYTVGNAITLVLPFTLGGAVPLDYSLEPLPPGLTILPQTADTAPLLTGIPSVTMPATPVIYTVTAADGSTVTLPFVITVVNSLPPETLTLGTVSNVNLNLKFPIITADGKIYYYLDADNNGGANDLDLLDHADLDNLLNDGNDTSATQEGNHDGSDDQRSVRVGAYTLILPTLAELITLRTDRGNTYPSNWGNGFYNSATGGSATRNQHTLFDLGDASIRVANDDVAAYGAFQVLSVIPISFEQAEYTIVEGTTGTIILRAEQPPIAEARIRLIANSETVLDNEYQLSPTDIVFESGQNTASFEVSISDDAIVQSTRQLSLSFMPLNNNAIPGAVPETVINIENNDVPSVSEDDLIVTVVPSELSIERFSTVALVIEANADVEVNISDVEGLVIVQGDKSFSLSREVRQEVVFEGIDEGSGIITITVQADIDGAEQVTEVPVEVTAPTLEIVSDLDMVSLVAGSSTDLRISVMTTRGDGVTLRTTVDDDSVASVVPEIATGVVTEQVIEVRGVNEGNTDITVSAEHPDYPTTRRVIPVEVIDRLRILVASESSETITLMEGQNEDVAVTLNRIGDTAVTVAVTESEDGLVTVTDELVFTSGLGKTLNIAVPTDEQFTGNREVKLTLSAAGYTTATVTVRIEEDDPELMLSLSTTRIDIAENEEGSVIVEVRGLTGVPATVRVTVTGNKLEAIAEELIFTDSTTQSLTIRAINDGIYEGSTINEITFSLVDTDQEETLEVSITEDDPIVTVSPSELRIERFSTVALVIEANADVAVAISEVEGLVLVQGNKLFSLSREARQEVVFEGIGERSGMITITARANIDSVEQVITIPATITTPTLSIDAPATIRFADNEDGELAISVSASGGLLPSAAIPAMLRITTEGSTVQLDKSALTFEDTQTQTVMLEALRLGVTTLTLTAGVGTDGYTETSAMVVVEVIDRLRILVAGDANETVTLTEGQSTEVAVTLNRIGDTPVRVTVTVSEEDVITVEDELVFVSGLEETLSITPVPGGTRGRTVELTLSAAGYTTATVTVTIIEDELPPIGLNVDSPDDLSLLRFTSTEIAVSVEAGAELLVETGGAVSLSADGATTMSTTTLTDAGMTSVEIYGVGEGDGTVRFTVSGAGKATDTVELRVSVTRPILEIVSVSTRAISLDTFDMQTVSVRVNAQAGTPRVILAADVIEGRNLVTLDSREDIIIRGTAIIDAIERTTSRFTFLVRSLADAGSATIVITASNEDYVSATEVVTVAVSLRDIELSVEPELDIVLGTSEVLSVTVAPTMATITITVSGNEEGNIDLTTEEIILDGNNRFTREIMGQQVSDNPVTLEIRAQAEGYTEASTTVLVEVIDRLRILVAGELSETLVLLGDEGEDVAVTLNRIGDTTVTVAVTESEEDVITVEDELVFVSELEETLSITPVLDGTKGLTVELTLSAAGYTTATVMVTPIESEVPLSIDAQTTIRFTDNVFGELPISVSASGGSLPSAGIPAMLGITAVGETVGLINTELEFTSTDPQTVLLEALGLGVTTLTLTAGVRTDGYIETSKTVVVEVIDRLRILVAGESSKTVTLMEGMSTNVAVTLNRLADSITLTVRTDRDEIMTADNLVFNSLSAETLMIESLRVDSYEPSRDIAIELSAAGYTTATVIVRIIKEEVSLSIASSATVTFADNEMVELPVSVSVPEGSLPSAGIPAVLQITTEGNTVQLGQSELTFENTDPKTVLLEALGLGITTLTLTAGEGDDGYIETSETVVVEVIDRLRILVAGESSETVTLMEGQNEDVAIMLNRIGDTAVTVAVMESEDGLVTVIEELVFTGGFASTLNIAVPTDEQFTGNREVALTLSAAGYTTATVTVSIIEEEVELSITSSSMVTFADNEMVELPIRVSASGGSLPSAGIPAMLQITTEGETVQLGQSELEFTSTDPQTVMLEALGLGVTTLTLTAGEGNDGYIETSKTVVVEVIDRLRILVAGELSETLVLLGDAGADVAVTLNRIGDTPVTVTVTVSEENVITVEDELVFVSGFEETLNIAPVPGGTRGRTVELTLSATGYTTATIMVTPIEVEVPLSIDAPTTIRFTDNVFGELPISVSASGGSLPSAGIPAMLGITAVGETVGLINTALEFTSTNPQTVLLEALGLGVTTLTLTAGVGTDGYIETSTTVVVEVIDRLRILVAGESSETVTLMEGSSTNVAVTLNRIGDTPARVTVTVSEENVITVEDELEFTGGLASTLNIAVPTDEQFTGNREVELTLSAAGYTTATVTVMIIDDDIGLTVDSPDNLSLLRFTSTEIAVSVEAEAELLVETGGAVSLSADGAITMSMTTLTDAGMTSVEIYGVGEGDGTVRFTVSGAGKATDTVELRVSVTRPILEIVSVSTRAISLDTFDMQTVSVRVNAQAGTPRVILAADVIEGRNLVTLDSREDLIISGTAIIDAIERTTSRFTFLVRSLADAGSATIVITASNEDYVSATEVVTVAVSLRDIELSVEPELDIVLGTSEVLSVTVAPTMSTITIIVSGNEEGNIDLTTEEIILDGNNRLTREIMGQQVSDDPVTLEIRAQAEGYTETSATVVIEVIDRLRILVAGELSETLVLLGDEGADVAVMLNRLEEIPVTVTVTVSEENVITVADELVFVNELEETLNIAPVPGGTRGRTVELTLSAAGYTTATIMVTPIESEVPLSIDAQTTIRFTDNVFGELPISVSASGGSLPSAGIPAMLGITAVGETVGLINTELEFTSTNPQTVLLEALGLGITTLTLTAGVGTDGYIETSTTVVVEVIDRLRILVAGESSETVTLMEGMSTNVAVTLNRLADSITLTVRTDRDEIMTADNLVFSSLSTETLIIESLRVDSYEPSRDIAIELSAVGYTTATVIVRIIKEEVSLSIASSATVTFADNEMVELPVSVSVPEGSLPSAGIPAVLQITTEGNTVQLGQSELTFENTDPQTVLLEALGLGVTTLTLTAGEGDDGYIETSETVVVEVIDRLRILVAGESSETVTLTEGQSTDVAVTLNRIGDTTVRVAVTESEDRLVTVIEELVFTDGFASTLNIAVPTDEQFTGNREVALTLSAEGYTAATVTVSIIEEEVELSITSSSMVTFADNEMVELPISVSVPEGSLPSAGIPAVLQITTVGETVQLGQSELEFTSTDPQTVMLEALGLGVTTLTLTAGKGNDGYIETSKTVVVEVIDRLRILVAGELSETLVLLGDAGADVTVMLNRLEEMPVRVTVTVSEENVIIVEDELVFVNELEETLNIAPVPGGTRGRTVELTLSATGYTTATIMVTPIEVEVPLSIDAPTTIRFTDNVFGELPISVSASGGSLPSAGIPAMLGITAVGETVGLINTALEFTSTNPQTVLLEALGLGITTLTLTAGVGTDGYIETSTTVVVEVIDRLRILVAGESSETVTLMEGMSTNVAVTLNRIGDTPARITVTVSEENVITVEDELEFTGGLASTLNIAVPTDEQFTGNREVELTLSAAGYTTATVRVMIIDDDIGLNVDSPDNLSLLRFTSTEIAVSVEAGAELLVETGGAVGLSADGATTMSMTTLTDAGMTSVRIHGVGEGDGTVRFTVSGAGKATDTVELRVSVTRPILEIVSVSTRAISLDTFDMQTVSVRVNAQAGTPRVILAADVIEGRNLVTLDSREDIIIRGTAIIDAIERTTSRFTFLVRSLADAGSATIVITASNEDYVSATEVVTVAVSLRDIDLTVAPQRLDIVVREAGELTIGVGADSDIDIAVSSASSDIASVMMMDSLFTLTGSAGNSTTIEIIGNGIGETSLTITASAEGYATETRTIDVDVLSNFRIIARPEMFNLMEGTTTEIEVRLSQIRDGDSSVTVTIEAIDGSDSIDGLNVIPSSITFNSTEVQSVTVTAVNNRNYTEGPRVVQFRLTATTGYMEEMVTVNIIDDERLITLTIDEGTDINLLRFGQTPITVQVGSSDGMLSGVMLNVATTGAVTLAGGSTSTSLVLSGRQTSAQIDILGDSVGAGTVTFTAVGPKVVSVPVAVSVMVSTPTLVISEVRPSVINLLTSETTNLEVTVSASGDDNPTVTVAGTVTRGDANIVMPLADAEGAADMPVIFTVGSTNTPGNATITLTASHPLYYDSVGTDVAVMVSERTIGLNVMSPSSPLNITVDMTETLTITTLMPPTTAEITITVEDDNNIITAPLTGRTYQLNDANRQVSVDVTAGPNTGNATLVITAVQEGYRLETARISVNVQSRLSIETNVDMLDVTEGTSTPISVSLNRIEDGTVDVELSVRVSGDTDGVSVIEPAEGLRFSDTSPRIFMVSVANDSNYIENRSVVLTFEAPNYQPKTVDVNITEDDRAFTLATVGDPATTLLRFDTSEITVDVNEISGGMLSDVSLDVAVEGAVTLAGGIDSFDLAGRTMPTNIDIFGDDIGVGTVTFTVSSNNADDTLVFDPLVVELTVSTPTLVISEVNPPVINLLTSETTELVVTFSAIGGHDDVTIAGMVLPEGNANIVRSLVGLAYTTTAAFTVGSSNISGDATIRLIASHPLYYDSVGTDVAVSVSLRPIVLTVDPDELDIVVGMSEVSTITVSASTDISITAMLYDTGIAAVVNSLTEFTLTAAENSSTIEVMAGNVAGENTTLTVVASAEGYATETRTIDVRVRSESSIEVSPSRMLNLTEGTETTIGVSLSRIGGGETVMVNIVPMIGTIDNSLEGLEVSPRLLTFTSTEAQSVTVTAVDNRFYTGSRVVEFGLTAMGYEAETVMVDIEEDERLITLGIDGDTEINLLRFANTPITVQVGSSDGMLSGVMLNVATTGAVTLADGGTSTSLVLSDGQTSTQIEILGDSGDRGTVTFTAVGPKVVSDPVAVSVMVSTPTLVISQVSNNNIMLLTRDTTNVSVVVGAVARAPDGVTLTVTVTGDDMLTVSEPELTNSEFTFAVGSGFEAGNATVTLTVDHPDYRLASTELAVSVSLRQIGLSVLSTPLDLVVGASGELIIQVNATVATQATLTASVADTGIISIMGPEMPISLTGDQLAGGASTSITVRGEGQGTANLQIRVEADGYEPATETITVTVAGVLNLRFRIKVFLEGAQ